MKKLTGLLCIVLLSFALTACGSEDDEDTNTPEPSSNITTEDETSEPIPSPNMETITVFTIDPANMAIMPSQVKKNEADDSVEYITKLVRENLEDDEIRVSSATQKGERAIIAFDSKSKPVKGCDEEMEDLILECFANSILDNVDGIHEVSFCTDKGPYISENKEMEADEIYASR